MPNYQLSNIRARTSRLESSSPQPITLHSLLESPPEPTQTASGVVPGQALFDTPEPNVEGPEPQEPAPQDSIRRSQRVHIDTPAIAQFREEVQEQKARQDRRKSRQSSAAGDSATATEHSTAEEGVKAKKTHRKRRKSHKLEKSNGGSASEQSTRHVSDSRPDQPDSGTYIMAGREAPSRRGGPDSSSLHREGLSAPAMSQSSGPGVPEIPGIPGSAPGSDHGPGVGELRLDIGQRPRSHDSGSGSGSRPGPSPDSGSRKPSSRDPALEHKRLVDELTRRTGGTAFAKIPLETLKLMLQEVVRDQTPEVESPKRKAQAIQAQALAKNPINVGGGHHMKLMHSNKAGSTARHNTDTDTEPESNENTDTEPEIDSEPEFQTRKSTNALTRRRAFYSPSPLPTSHVPIDPDLLHQLELPINHVRETLGTTQDSTQPELINNLDPAPKPPTHRVPKVLVPGTQTQLETLHRWESTDSVSLGDPPHVRPSASRFSSQQSAPSSSAARTRPLRLPSTPTPAPAPAPAPTTNAPSCSRASGPSRPDLGILRPHGNPGQSSRPLNERCTLSKGAARALRDSAPGPSNRASGSSPPSGTAFPGEFVREHYRTRRERRARAPASNGDNPKDGATLEPGRTPSRPDLMSDNEEQRVAAAAAASGREPKRGRKKKPAARDIHGNERFVLTVAKQHLFAYALTEGAWQTRGLFARWAPPVYIETWEQELPGVPIEPPSPETIQIMVNGLATGRGKVKDVLRPFTQYTFGFEKPALNNEAIDRNLAIFREIHPNRFHCLEYQPAYGHYESNALSQAIAVALFSNPTSVGVTFRNYFDPMPLTTVAFVLANDIDYLQVQFCIEEYEHGQYQPHDLNAADMLNKYVAHLRGLKEARAGAKARMLRLQQEWFDYGFEYSGAMMIDDPYTQMITLRSEIRPDTPPADDEAEQPDDFLPEDESEGSEAEDNGRYSKRAKGKGRA
ncbi:hypothetical protein FRC06_008817 [Ceratobasidium sp. 370]|nr:hypothetical protein FRC06_008817 [Ceratobasidium sp. 370]